MHTIDREHHFALRALQTHARSPNINSTRLRSQTRGASTHVEVHHTHTPRASHRLGKGGTLSVTSHEISRYRYRSGLARPRNQTKRATDVQQRGMCERSVAEQRDNTSSVEGGADERHNKQGRERREERYCITGERADVGRRGYRTERGMF